MQFKKAKEILSEKLKEQNIKNIKCLRKPGRGDFINRLAYQIATGRLKVVRKEYFGEIIPGKIIEKVNCVNFLIGKGDTKADAVIVKGNEDFPEEKILTLKNLQFPSIAIDMSFFYILKDREKKGLLNQIELTYGIVKDYFTPDNFFILDENLESISVLKNFFHPHIPFKIRNKIPKNRKIIVLDPNGEKTLEKDEIDTDTVLIFGGIVDHGERLTGATREIFKNAPHRKITYKGSTTPVPDRINELTKIVCDFLTLPITLDEAVIRNLTRQGKLRIIREKLQEKILKIKTEKGRERILPLSDYLSLKKEFNLTEFHFRKGGKHVHGFKVVKDDLIDKIKTKSFIDSGELNEYTIKKYP
ncbi:hypothetical protein [Desulfurobacterium atlanticum]|uniref:tRNA (Adenine9-N1/guanine9-N1)-methyltransferase n=1 Tax=Desulfurobacterium atlanticum TaxID=240169 RepID=A0A238XKX5_9BACT|nr:hypothetical protein [Desulfurobacterium atlanticum]SNR59587.1 tRNA (adenine9-N1/guanine9-N1)-methyltransferase [Desulfurobacterium atlanticum]